MPIYKVDVRVSGRFTRQIIADTPETALARAKEYTRQKFDAALSLLGGQPTTDTWTVEVDEDTVVELFPRNK
jgi:hypothetical protein|tara:strand:+ start:1000 stop:1215 length:216 start_codon:yes stop_codon:yes gene_type:complete